MQKLQAVDKRSIIALDIDDVLLRKAQAILDYRCKDRSAVWEYFNGRDG